MSIKPVEYDDCETTYKEDAVCPYCGYENYVEPESYMGQEEEDEMECGECEKTFIYSIHYSVSFCSEPFENWASRKMNNCLGNIKHYKELMSEAPTNRERGLNKEYYKAIIEYKERELDELKKKVEEVLGG